MGTIYKPQPGPQEQFARSPADITIYGGSAGGGKSFGLLLNALRYKNVPGFDCTIFRRNFNQIFANGGLWDDSVKIYADIPGAYPRWSRGCWVFNDGNGNQISKVTFAHIEKNLDVHKWQGSQLTMLCFDELTHFSEYIFFYMMSRNRSTCGVKPSIKATCNPDSDSWVAKFIEWWIDQDTGYPIKERSGKIRWFIRRDGQITWANHKETLWKKFDLVTEEEKQEPRSVTFISSSIYDNQELLKVNPQYLSSLKALPEIEKERLLFGNWKIKEAAGLFFKRTQVDILDIAPTDFVSICRAWDIAATGDKESSGDPDFTSGVLMGRRKDGRFVVLDVINQRVRAGEVERLIKNTAIADKARWGYKCKIRIPQDPGAAGKIVAGNYVKMLAGFSVKTSTISGNKQVRANPFAAQWQNGNVSVVAAYWNDMYFSQLESFPQSKHDDMVDASSDAFNEVAEPKFNLKNMI